MDAVTDPKRTIRNAWCYDKGQNILVKKSWNPKLGKSKNKIARKKKAAKKLVKKSSKTVARKKRGVTEGSATTTSKKAQLNSRSAHPKNMTKNPTLLQKLKGLAAEAEDDEDMVSELISQAESDNNNYSMDHIITNSTVIKVLICQTRYNSPTIVHSLENLSQKKDWYNKKIWVRLEKGNHKMMLCGLHYNPDSSGGRR